MYYNDLKSKVMKVFRSKMKRYLIPLLFVILCVSCGFKSDSGDAPQAPDIGDPEKADRIILKIQDTFYFNSDFDRYISRVSGVDYKTLSLASLSRLYDSFIEEKLLLDAAKENQISLSPEEEKSYLSKWASQSLGDGEKTPQEGFDAKVVHERLIVDKLIYSLIDDIEVGEGEVSQYYEENKKDFLRPEQVRVSQILVDSEDQAYEIYERVKDVSEEGFRSVAREVSVGVEAEKGGEMGVFAMGQLPIEMEKVVFALKQDEISPVIQSSYGYHIFRLDEKLEPKLVTLDEAFPEIRMKILDRKIKEAIAKYIMELKSGMDWTSTPENLAFSYQRKSDE